MSAKTLYLAVPVVARFVEWLGTHLDSATLAHTYTNRLTKAHWHCESLFDAYRKYDWRQPTLPGLPAAGSSFAANAATLNALSLALRAALSPPNDAATCMAATHVMAWGGVTPGNVRWLNVNTLTLAALLLTVKGALDSHALGGSVLTNRNLRFNAGMTKVYSLICDGLIIYDSRVAAALGWAVALFCQAQGLGTVPPELNFPWAPAKAAPNQPNPKRRDPSVGALTFQKLTSGPRHAEWNLKASWVLEAALACPAGQLSQFGQDRALPTPALQLRAVEAALFMIGYDLGGGTAAAHQAVAAESDGQPHTQAQAQAADGWIDCWTSSHKNHFRYAFTTDGIKVEKGTRFSLREINGTLDSLWRYFGPAPFPLANNRDEVPAGKAEMGLGTAYWQTTNKSAALSSKLAAILEDLMIFLPVRAATGKGLHWQLNLQILQPSTEGGLPDVTSWLEALAG